MARLRGRGVGAGMALGTAAVVRTHGGIALLPEPPPRITDQIAARRLTETPEVILVAEDYRIALSLAASLSWAKVVGIAAVVAEGEIPISERPAVVEVSDLLGSVTDDMLMLVDAERGIVLADPDPVYLAQYTAEHDRIAPKRRLFLGDRHLPAQTVDGRSMLVIAAVTDVEDIAEALEGGADALYTEPRIDLTTAEDATTPAEESLLPLAEAAAGKPLILRGDNSLLLGTLLEAANIADILLAVPPRFDRTDLGLGDVGEALKAAEAECQEQDQPYSLPRLALDATLDFDPYAPEPETEWITVAAAHGATRLIVSVSYDAIQDALTGMDRLIQTAAGQTLPVFVQLTAFLAEEAQLLEAVRSLVALGAAGVIVAPHETSSLKQAIAEMNASELRDTLLGTGRAFGGGGAV